MRATATVKNDLVLRRREAASKDAPVGAEAIESWSVLRDAALSRGSSA
jgi:hypothetical protein